MNIYNFMQKKKKKKKKILKLKIYIKAYSVF